MSDTLVNLIWKNKPTGGHDLLVLLEWAEQADDYGTLYASKETIAANLKLSKSTVQRSTIKLLADGILVDTGARKYHANKSWTPVYSINIEEIVLSGDCKNAVNFEGESDNLHRVGQIDGSSGQIDHPNPLVKLTRKDVAFPVFGSSSGTESVTVAVTGRALPASDVNSVASLQNPKPENREPKSQTNTKTKSDPCPASQDEPDGAVSSEVEGRDIVVPDSGGAASLNARPPASPSPRKVRNAKDGTPYPADFNAWKNAERILWLGNHDGSGKVKVPDLLEEYDLLAPPERKPAAEPKAKTRSQAPAAPRPRSAEDEARDKAMEHYQQTQLGRAVLHSVVDGVAAQEWIDGSCLCEGAWRDGVCQHCERVCDHFHAIWGHKHETCRACGQPTELKKVKENRPFAAVFA